VQGLLLGGAENPPLFFLSKASSKASSKAREVQGLLLGGAVGKSPAFLKALKSREFAAATKVFCVCVYTALLRAFY
jgi:hypothetical protein